MKLTLLDFVKNTVYEEAIVKEGGNAVQGVSRIKRELIKPTLNKFIELYITPLFNFTIKDPAIFVFGSTRQKTRFW